MSENQYPSFHNRVYTLMPSNVIEELPYFSDVPGSQAGGRAKISAKSAIESL